MDYCCHKCCLQGSFSKIIEHFISTQPNLDLMISRRLLNPATGKMARLSIDFSFIPNNVIQRGGDIKIDGQSQKVHVIYPKSPFNRRNAETQTDTSCNKTCDLVAAVM